MPLTLEKKSIRLEDETIAYLEAGQGHPLILIHGIPTSSELWIEIVPLLTQHYRVLAPDLLNYGDSSKPVFKDLGIAAQADLLVHWMASLGIDRAAIAGHDIGGGIAQYLATRYPDQVSHLILIDSVCYDSWPIREMNALQATSLVIERLPPDWVHRALVADLRRGFHRKDADQLLARFLEPFKGPEGIHAFMRNVRALDNRYTKAIAPDLPGIRIPTLILWGEDDPFQDPKFADRLAQDIPTAECHKIPRGGHFLPLNQPQELARLSHSFLERNPESWDAHYRPGAVLWFRSEGKLGREVTLSPIRPEEAEGHVAALYEDILDVLQRPLVPLEFQAFAQYPVFLEFCWKELRANVVLPAFDEQVRALRERTHRVVEALGNPFADLPLDAEPVSRMLERMAAQSLLLATACREGISGHWKGGGNEAVPYRADSGFPPQQHRDRFVPLEMVAQPEDSEARRVFQEMSERLESPIVDQPYQVLAATPALLKTVWQPMATAFDGPGYQAAIEELDRFAVELADGWPSEVYLGNLALSLYGFRAEDLDHIHDLIYLFHGLSLHSALHMGWWHASLTGTRQCLDT